MALEEKTLTNYPYMITKLFWKTFYKLKLGDDYVSTLKAATLTSLSTKEVTKGNLSSFYNNDGQQIRGWHRPMTYSKKYVSKDPIQKYISEYSR